MQLGADLRVQPVRADEHVAAHTESVPLALSRTRTRTPAGDSANETNAVPVRTAPGPSRSRTAPSRIICSSPR